MGVLTLVMLASMVVMGVLLIVVMMALFVLAREIVERLIDGIVQVLEDLGESIAAIPQSVSDAVSDALRIETRARTETRVELAESINSMGMLVTASHSGDAVVKVGVQAGLLNLCGASVNHIVEGTIEAGVDISQVQADDIFHDPLNDRWVLNLGAAGLHSCRIDYIRQQGHSITACHQDWDAYRLLAESAAIEEIRDEALAGGLLAGAEQQAQVVLGNFLSAITGSDNITIVFESEPNIEFPESCLREQSTGWVFDEESDSWLKE